MSKDLRTFLKEYETSYPEDVVHIEKPISTLQEMTVIVERLEKQNKWPVLIFENPIMADGRKSDHKVITNLLASRTRYARVCGATFEDVGVQVYERTRSQRITPIVIKHMEAPVKEVVKTGEQVDLMDFPATWHNALDAGLYFAAGFLTTYDPDSGIDNCALQRGWIMNKDTIRALIRAMPGHNGVNMSKYEQRNQDMKVCFWQGHHPLAYIGGLAKLGYPESHWEATGGMLGEPLRLVPSETLGDDFLVPADAELVVEGVVEANKRYPEGPFGENPGYYGGQILNPQIKVTAITYRKDYIWYDIAAAMADHKVTGAPPVEGQLWEMLKPRFPNLQRIYVPLSGNGRYHIYMQFKNPILGEGRQAILLALTARRAIKHAFAFDDDVDIYDPKEVMWAIATRSQWDRDVIIIPNTKSIPLDPSSRPPAAGALGGIDCTKPWGEFYEERVGVEPEIMERIRLEDFVSRDTLARIIADRQAA